MCELCGSDCKALLRVAAVAGATYRRARTIQREKKDMGWVSDRRLYLNADKTAVVEEGSEDANSLLVGPGGVVSDEDVKKYNLGESPGGGEEKSALDKERELHQAALNRGAYVEASARANTIATMESAEEAEKAKEAEAETGQAGTGSATTDPASKQVAAPPTTKASPEPTAGGTPSPS